MKAKCPYCGRKITYAVRFMERGEGEHYCKSCKKPSDIVQNKNIWLLFAGSIVLSLLVLFFYLIFANAAQHDYNENGSYAFLVAVFFGKFKTFKWIFWEILPYLAFLFISPLFINYQMQKKYAYSTADKLDLDEEFLPPVKSDMPATGSTRVIPKVGVSKVEDDFDFEEISSSSNKVSDTRSFNLKEALTEIDPESYVKSASAGIDAPLKKVERVKPQEVRISSEPQELYRVKLLREQEQKKRELQAEAKNIDKAMDKNYSANRKF